MKTHLGAIAVLFAGRSIRGSVEALEAGNVALVQAKDVDPEHGIDWRCAVRVSLSTGRGGDHLSSGDVLFTSRGTRNVAVAVSNPPGVALCAANLFVIRLNPGGNCLPDYLAWYMNQRPARLYFQKSAMGSNILNIRREDLERFEVPLPPPERQRAIAEFDVSARRERQVLRGLIENRDQQMEALAAGLAQDSEMRL